MRGRRRRSMSCGCTRRNVEMAGLAGAAEAASPSTAPRSAGVDATSIGYSASDAGRPPTDGCKAAAAPPGHHRSSRPPARRDCRCCTVRTWARRGEHRLNMPRRPQASPPPPRGDGREGGIAEQSGRRIPPLAPNPPPQGEGNPLGASGGDPTGAGLSRGGRRALPEIPVLTLEDLGICGGGSGGGRIVVRLTPTYRAARDPAIRLAVERRWRSGPRGGQVGRALAAVVPTTSRRSRRKLKDFGIASPGRAGGRALFADETTAAPIAVRLPPRRSPSRLHSLQGTVRCESCAEPFDAFKCL